MRLGLDLDGVIADLEGALIREAARLFPNARPPAGDVAEPTEAPEPEVDDGEPMPSVSLPRLSRRQQRELWRTVARTRDFWETLDEIEAGSIRRLARLAERRRWEVIFLTSRPRADGATVQVQTQRWLTHHGFPLPSVFVVSQSRGRIAHALELDLVVDDRPESCLDIVLESSARAVLVWPGEAATVPASAKRLGIGVVPSIGACLDLLEQVEPSSGSGPGLMRTLRRLLGLAPPDAGSPRRALANAVDRITETSGR